MAQRNLKRQGFRTFLPLFEETTRKSGRFVSVIRPVFAGYIFIALDPAKGGWHAINSTYGVTRLVSFGGDPRAVPADLIAPLIARCDADGKLLPAPQIKTGDNIRIIDGPFAEFVATVEKIGPDRRVWVLLELMGRTARVALNPEAVLVV